MSVRVDDYGDIESLARAFQGIDRVMLIASNQFQQRARQHQNVVAAVKAAGLERHLHLGQR